MSELTSFNCTCESTSSYATLATLRARMMRRLGYSAQASNPPPGMAALLDDFLQSAQRILYEKKPELRTKRFYRWAMTAGVRYYGISASDETGCAKKLNPFMVDWVGFEDLNSAWYPLIHGIDPRAYTTADTAPGWPSHYEIRSCIEIWPAPQAAYTLWVKGDFGLEAFSADTDTTAINDELVFLLALGNAKAHYGQRDSSTVLGQLDSMLNDLRAGKHATARYVPGARPMQPALTPPRFLPLEES